MKSLLYLLVLLLAACAPARTLPPDVRGFPGLTPDEIGRWRLDDEAGRERTSPVEPLARELGLGPGTDLADVGAGGGFHMVRLAPRVERYYAVDVDPRALEILRHRSRGLGNVEVVASTPEEARLPAAGVDVVLLSETWHVVAHQPTAPAFLASLHRALREDGLLAVLETSAAEWVNPRTGRREPNLRYVDPAEATRRLEAEGFRLERRVDLGPEYLLLLRPRRTPVRLAPAGR